MVQIQKSLPLTTKAKNFVLFILAVIIAYFMSIFGMKERPNEYGIDPSETKRPLKKKSNATIRGMDTVSKKPKKDGGDLGDCPTGG